jgi:hypothetical protein
MNLVQLIGVMIPILGIGLGFVAVIGAYWMQNQKMKLRMFEAQRGADSAANLATQTELEKLRERVAVLERLITDEDRRVASEISRLGDNAGVRR